MPAINPDLPVLGERPWADKLVSAIETHETQINLNTAAIEGRLSTISLDAAYGGGSGGGAVASVNGQTGTVVLTQDSVADGTTAKQFTATEKTKLAGIGTAAALPSYANLPAGTTLTGFWDGTSTQPTRPTNRTDIHYVWIQPSAPPAGGSYALPGDEWRVIP
jgi:hypothetical protein